MTDEKFQDGELGFQLETIAPQLEALAPTTMDTHAERYGVEVRTVQRWGAAGRKVNDPPPLENPPEMCAWWERLRALGVWKQRIPPEIEVAAAKWATSTDDEVTVPSAEEMVEEIANQPIDLTEFETAEMTFGEGARMAKLNYQVHAKLLRTALASGKPDVMRNAHSAFEKAFEMYVTSEGRKAKIMAEQGLTVPREEVRRVLVEVHSVIPKRIKASLKQAWKLLPEPRCPQIVWTAAVEKVVDQACLQLAESRFVPPEQAVAM